MSTKIYYGCRVHLDDSDLLAFQERMAAAVGAAYEPLYLRTVVALAFDIAAGAAPETFAEGAFTPAHTGIQPLFTAAELLDQAHRIVEAKGIRHPLDLQFEVVFLRSGDPTCPLAIPYTERAVLRDTFMALPEVEPWGYWDNTDRDDNVTDAEWDERRDVWARAVDGRAPAQRGLTWKLVMSDGHWMFPSHLPPEKLAEYAPTSEERARGEARERARRAATDGRYRIPDDPWGRLAHDAMNADIERFTAEIAPALAPLDVADILRVQDSDSASRTR